MPPRADWITFAELVAITGWDRSTVFRKQGSGELKTRPGARMGNGKSSQQYNASDLPMDFQAKRLTQKITAAPLALVKSSEHPVVKLDSPDSDKVIRSLASLDPEDRKQAEQRLQVIAPMIKFVNTKNGSTPLFKLGAGSAEITSLSEIVKHLVTVGLGSESSIWRWWKAYKRGGPGALADGQRSDANLSRFFSRHKDAAAFATNKFLNERLSVRLTHEALDREWHRLRLNAGDAPPSYETTRVFLNSLSPIISPVSPAMKLAKYFGQSFRRSPPPPWRR
ncbi:MAG: hypothetical protein LAO20_10355 [Acidobacteriia bacterium]|nr:hypothetical protein [Terriglobia bacterium]